MFDRTISLTIGTFKKEHSLNLKHFWKKNSEHYTQQHCRSTAKLAERPQTLSVIPWHSHFYHLIMRLIMNNEPNQIGNNDIQYSDTSINNGKSNELEIISF